MILPTLFQTVPAALGIALSPFPVVAVILVLATPAAVRNGSAFAIGWLAGLGALTAVVLVLGSSADSSGSNTTIDVVRVILGTALLIGAYRKWHSRPRAGDEVVLPGWMAGIEKVSTGRALVLGAALGGLNPKNMALGAAGAATIVTADLGTNDTVITAVLFVLLASCTVVGAVTVRLVGGDRAAEPLAQVRDFMQRNNAVIMMIVLLVLGAKILADGLTGLTG